MKIDGKKKISHDEFSKRFEPWVQSVIADARAQGLSVGQYRGSRPLHVKAASLESLKQSALSINGKPCSLHLVAPEWRHGSAILQRYRRLRLHDVKGSPFGFFIIYQVYLEGIEERSRIFIAPRESILQKYGDREYVDLLVPTRKVGAFSAVREREGGLLRFEDAWYFLKA